MQAPGQNEQGRPTPPPGWYGDPWQQAPQRWWTGEEWSDRTRDAADPEPAAAPAVPEADEAVRLLVVGGSALMVVSAFLPWIQMTAPLVGRVSAPGVEGDGVFTLVFGVILVVVSWPLLKGREISRQRASGIFVLAGLAGALAVFTLVNVLDGARQADMIFGQVGIGLWLTLAAAAAVFGGAWRELLINRDDQLRL